MITVLCTQCGFYNKPTNLPGNYWQIGQEAKTSLALCNTPPPPPTFFLWLTPMPTKRVSHSQTHVFIFQLYFFYLILKYWTPWVFRQCILVVFGLFFLYFYSQQSNRYINKHLEKAGTYVHQKGLSLGIKQTYKELTR